MSHIGEVCSLVPRGMPLMALIAIATSVLRTEVTRMLGMRDELVVSMLPCKANIVCAVGAFTNISETFHPVLDSFFTLCTLWFVQYLHVHTREQQLLHS